MIKATNCLIYAKFWNWKVLILIFDFCDIFCVRFFIMYVMNAKLVIVVYKLSFFWLFFWHAIAISCLLCLFWRVFDLKSCVLHMQGVVVFLFFFLDRIRIERLFLLATVFLSNWHSIAVRFQYSTYKLKALFLFVFFFFVWVNQ